MTIKGVTDLAHMMVASYPSFRPDSMKDTINAWMFLLDEYPDEAIAKAFKEYLKTASGNYPPSINQLIAIVNKPVETVFLNEVEAWALVSNAIRRSGYYAEEEFKKLPEPVQKALGSPTMLRAWALDGEFNEDVAMSNFCRTYRTVIEREKDKVKCDTQTVLKINANPDIFRELLINGEERHKLIGGQHEKGNVSDLR